MANSKRQKIFSRIPLLILLSHFTATHVPYLEAAEKMAGQEIKEDKYQINFNNVSALEYVRFVSKITGKNFIFNDTDLQFNVTIVSEEPMTTKNIMATFLQVLRVHNLKLLEQDNSLVIIPIVEVNQLSTVVSSDLHNELSSASAPMVTRIFRIKNANIASLATILRPMLSETALIEVASDTRQLIVSDITANVDKVSELLESLDSSHTPLEVDVYEAKFTPPDELILLVNQLISPFAEGNPFILVPHTKNNSIFVVSTEKLIERAMTLLQDLDKPAQARAGGVLSLVGNDIYFYKVETQTPEYLLDAVQKAVHELKLMEPKPEKLLRALKEMKYIQESCSFMFVTDPVTAVKVKEILTDLDTICFPQRGKISFYIYRLEHLNHQQITTTLKKMAETFKSAKVPDEGLIAAINSMHYIPESNSLIFSGSITALDHLASLLPNLDVVSTVSADAPTQFFVYIPKNRPGDDIKSILDQIANNLQESGLIDPNSLHTFKSAKWNKFTNAFVFTGNTASINQVKQLLEEIDIPAKPLQKFPAEAGEYTFYIYHLKYADGDMVEKNLLGIANRLDLSYPPNQALSQVIKDIQWMKEQNALVITGPAKTVDMVKQLIDQYDQVGGAPEVEIEQILKETETAAPTTPTPQAGKAAPKKAEKKSALVVQKTGTVSFALYKPKYVSAQQLMAYLKTIGKDLKRSKIEDTAIIDVIANMKHVKETDSILFTGTEKGLNEVGYIIDRYDLPPEGEAQAPIVRDFENLPPVFFVYKPEYVQGQELIGVLQDFATNLMNSGIEDKLLYDTIDSLKWVPKTSSILITGDRESVARVEELLIKFDLPGPIQTSIDNTTFLVYKLQYHQGSEIQGALQQLGQSLLNVPQATTQETIVPQEDLVSSINSLQWIQVTNSLIGTGNPDTLKKLKMLISNLDVPLKQVFIEVLAIQTSISNSQSFGLEWAGRAKYRSKLAGSFGNTIPASSGGSNPFVTAMNDISSVVFPNPAAIPTSGGLDFGVIGDIILHKGQSFLSLGSLINALQTDSDSSIILNPKIITQDNRNSTIFVGQNVPFVGSVTDTQGGINTQQTTNIEYRNVGVNLSITPNIGEEDIITLEISNEISSLPLGAPAVLNGSVSGLLTDQTTMNTRVHVPNKHFLVLSGIITDQAERGKTGIPCLGGLPVVGAAFSSTNRSVGIKNLLIFIRPHIIESWEDYMQVTQGTERLHKEYADLPMVKEEFDQAIERIETLD